MKTRENPYPRMKSLILALALASLAIAPTAALAHSKHHKHHHVVHHHHVGVVHHK